MEQLVLGWSGPFGIKDSIPYGLKGWPGLYLIEYDSEILYVGKAETEGAFIRAKDHFRGQGTSTGRWIREGRHEAKIQIWVGKKEWTELINNAEKLLIAKLNPRVNVNCAGKYRGKPLHIVNRGDFPKRLPKEIEYP